MNKIAAAILTVGRMQRLNRLETNDWIAEYRMWVEALDKLDTEAPKAEEAEGAAALTERR